MAGFGGRMAIFSWLYQDPFLHSLDLPRREPLEWNFDSRQMAFNLGGVAPSKKSIFSPRYDAFLGLLRAARQNAGLTQREAAQRMNRSQSYVAQSETGERRVDVIELVDFLAVYKVRPERFIKQVPPAPQE